MKARTARRRRAQAWDRWAMRHHGDHGVLYPVSNPTTGAFISLTLCRPAVWSRWRVRRNRWKHPNLRSLTVQADRALAKLAAGRSAA